MNSSGIYLLEFGSLYRYVGQAKDIQARVHQHINSLIAGKAADKLQKAYIMCGVPNVSIICYCHRDHLDALESYYIKLYTDPFSLNTTRPEPTFSFVDDTTIDYLQNSTQHLCESLQGLADDLVTIDAELVEAQERIEALVQARSDEEIAKDISNTIKNKLGEIEDLKDDLAYYKNWAKSVDKLPWYKKMFLKAP